MKKKWFDNFVVNAIIVMVVVLYMLVDEQRLYPGHPLSEDMLYGGFVAIGMSGTCGFARRLCFNHRFNWWHFGLGAVIGFAVAFGVGYLIYATA